MLSATLHCHLNQFQSHVATDMKNNLYVDNIISGTDGEAQAIQYYSEARSIMLDAKFNLRSWASNSKQLQALATNDDVVDKNLTVKTLGLRWNTCTDMITFASKAIVSSDPSVTTKREVLQHSARLYDPLGFLDPVTIQAKILMQELWQQKISGTNPLMSHTGLDGKAQQEI